MMQPTQSNGIPQQQRQEDDVPQTPTTLVVHAEKSSRYAMEPQSAEALFKLVGALAKSEIFRAREQGDLLAVAMLGRELGMTVMSSLNNIHIIEGRPSLSANAKEGLCLARPDICEKFEQVEATKEKATYRVKRKGREERLYTFTIEEAREAGLVDRGKDPTKNNWNKYPKRMLAARAKSLAADTEFQDILQGVATREELEDARILVQTTNPRTGQIVDAEFTPVDKMPTPVVSGPARDLSAETEALKKVLAEAKPSTPEEKRALREKVAAFVKDVGGAYAEDVKAVYYTFHAAKPANGTAPAAPTSDPKTETT